MTILQAARDKITTHGWIKGRVGSREVGFCILGAVSAAYLDGTQSQPFSIETYGGSLEKLRVHLADFGCEGMSIPEFNDHHATYEHVLALFDKAIADE